MIDTRNGRPRIDLPTEERFMRLFLEAERRIFGFLLALVPNWADAEDLLQETAAVLWRKFDEFEPGTDFLAWALTVARFQVLCHRKKQQRSRVRFSDQTVEVLAERLAAFTETSDRRLDALCHCLALLGDRDRELVQLRYAPGATTQGVAGQVGRSVDAVYKALNRIHTRLLFCIRRSLDEGAR
jgi:RNA polymerase sigma-70 factor (ECF subfamily)